MFTQLAPHLSANASPRQRLSSLTVRAATGNVGRTEGEGLMIGIGRAQLAMLGGAVVAFFLGALPLSAQAYRVKDINPGSGDGVEIYAFEAIDDEVVVVDGTLYFAADDGTNGQELWRSDGTEAGTVLVKDINPGPSSSSPRDLTRVGSVVFFRADDGGHGYELWKSDGTAAGTVLVKDINPGAPSGADPIPDSLDIFHSTSMGGLLFFIANDVPPVVGNILWRSDGTAEGTVPVNGAGPPPYGGVSYLRRIGSTLYFSAAIGPTFSERGLWKTDGMAAGTTLVRPFVGVISLTDLDGLLYFTADDGMSGAELWRSDGTPGGTVLVKEVNPGPMGSVNGPLQVASGRVFFSAFTAASGSHGLWVSDGTEVGTSLVKDITVGGVTRFVGVRGLTFFAAQDSLRGSELWRSDGTTAGTALVEDIGPGATDGLDGLGMKSLTCVNGALYFRGNDTGANLWTSDGTAAGTTRLQEFHPGRPSILAPLRGAGGLLYFNADDGLTGRELWGLDTVSHGSNVVSFARASSTVAEGAGTQSVAVKVTTPCETPTTAPVSVTYATVDGSAVEGDDYTAASGTLTFPAGSPSGSTLPIPVTILDDALDEGDETLLVHLSGPLGGTLGVNTTHTATIGDDDAPPMVSIGDVSVTEGDTGATPASFTVSLSAPSGKLVTVGHQTSDGTATAGADYAPAEGMIVFPEGSTLQTVAVAVTGDHVHESGETFFVNLSSPLNATLADGQGLGTIMDDDSQGLSIGHLEIAEPDSGSRTTRFTVTLSPTSAGTVTVEYSTADLTANSGSDYDAASGVLTFGPGVASLPVEVNVHADALAEGVETFQVNLANATGAAIAHGQGIGAVHDHGLSIADIAVVEPASGSRAARFTVTLSPTSGSPVSVDFSTAGVTASPSSDYDPASGTLTFPPGISTLAVDVVVHSDALTEGVETFQLNLANASGAAVASGQAVGRIHDPGSFFTIVPCRALDTRDPDGPAGGPVLTAGENRIVALASTCDISSSARAVSLNVTVTQPTTAGNLRLYPADTSLPLVSALNYSGGQTRGNNAVVGLSASGALAIRCVQASGSAHVIVDVNGYFE
jgi:ELWxxDGT repeat protein